MKKLIVLFLLSAYVASGQEELNLNADFDKPFHRTFQYSYKDDQGNNVTKTRYYIDFDLLDNGRVMQRLSELKLYKPKGSDDWSNKGYASIDVYDANQWVKGYSFKIKTYSEANNNYSAPSKAQENAENHYPTKLSTTENYIIHSYSPEKKSEVSIKNLEGKVLYTVYNKQLDYNAKSFLDAQEGSNNDIYLLFDQEFKNNLLLVHLTPNEEGGFSLGYKEIQGFKRGNSPEIHHVNKSILYLYYYDDGNYGVRGFNASDIDDDSKSQIGVSKFLSLSYDEPSIIFGVKNDGTLMYYFSDKDRSSGKYVTKMKVYNPLKNDSKAFTTLNHSRLDIQAIDSYNGETAVVIFPTSEQMVVEIYDENLNLKASTGLIEKKSIESFYTSETQSNNNVDINLKERKLLLVDSYQRNKKYMLFSF